MAVFSSDGGILDLFLHRLAEKRSRLVGAASAKQETEPEQKLFQRLFSLITFPAFILAGLDFRFGWTRQRFAEVPLMGVVGPYARVRHPMYTGMAVTALAIPLALGSYVTLPVFALMVPVLVYRLVHEEKTLRRNLPGYTEYCQRTRFRLVLWVW
jgi:hypothetical protein